MNELMQLYNTKGMLASVFMKYHADKGDILTRSEKYAGWTLPTLFPRDSTGTPEEMQMDFQSIGARATNHLANKLTLALFAPSRPFFKLEPDSAYEELLSTNGIDTATQLAVFSRAERDAMKAMMQRGVRVTMPLAMKLLIVTGNALKYFPTDGNKAQVYNLRDYCVKRDLSGNALDIITQDRKSLGTLPTGMQEALKADNPQLDNDADVTLYTRVRWHNKKFHVFQALNNIPYGEVHGSYTRTMNPWIPMTWNLSRGADYGSGLVEEYSGDFHALSSLSEAMVIGAAIAADIKFLVDPTGSTDFAALNSAPSGAYVPGRADDITALQIDKANDWSIVLQIISTYEKRIGMAFLLGSAVTRDAERVTAEEIRFQAMELETSLGGVYSRLAEDIQVPMAFIFLKDAKFDIGLGKELHPMIITGLDALSRNSESEALVLFLQDLALLGQLPPEVSGRLNLSPIIATFGAARGVDHTKLVKPEEQYQQEVQQANATAMEQQSQMEQNKENAKQE